MPNSYYTHKLITIWCALIVTILVVSSIITLSQLSKQQYISEKITALRAPTINTSLLMVNHVNKALASLRGWMLLKENHYAKELRESWVIIKNTEVKMQTLSEHWTNPKNQVYFKKIQALLSEFNQAQFKILKLSQQPNNIPSQQLLVEEATPLASALSHNISNLIKFEESQDITKNHKISLVDLTKLHDSLSVALANINAYTASKDEDLILNYELARTDSQYYIDALKNIQHNLKPYQQHLLENIIQDQEDFFTLTTRIIQLRKQKNWNQAKFLLKTQAAPTGQEIIQLLDKMVENQYELQQMDNQILLDISTYNFKSSLLFITILAIIISMWLGFLIYRRANKAQLVSNNKALLIDQNIMTAYLDTDGIIKDISNSLCREFDGIKTDFIGHQSYFFLHDKDKDPLYETINKSVKTGEIWEGEIIRINENNEKKWFHSKLIPTNLHDFEDNGYSIILYNITDKKHLEKISTVDKLTGLFNRRHFDNVFQQQIKIAKRHATSLTLCILDIDYFKKYNDHYGHQAGDIALSLVAITIKGCLKRPDDHVFRLGGEEFGIILCDLDITQVQEILDNLQQKIRNLEIKHQNSNINQNLTLSIGAQICHSVNNLSSADFYHDTDTVLYEAKKKRNCIIIKQS